MVNKASRRLRYRPPFLQRPLIEEAELAGEPGRFQPGPRNSTGVEPEDLDISVVAESLTLAGRRPLPETEEGAQWHRHERWHGEFSRTLQLPYRIDAENVEASFRNGVLSITLPRAEEDRPRRISIGASGSQGQLDVGNQPLEQSFSDESGDEQEE